MHFSEARAYCIQCRLRREVCLCQTVRRADADLKLLLVLHAGDARKMSNTGHLAKLVLRDSSLAVHGAHGYKPADLRELSETHAPDGRLWRTVLFYPGLGAKPLTPEYAEELRAPDPHGGPVRLRLVVPDGTWRQARHMVKRLPALAALPRVILPVVDALAVREGLRPRGNPDPARVSTCEAIAAAFGLLGEPDAEAALFEIYDAAALRIALMRGKLPLKDHRHVLV